MGVGAYLQENTSGISLAVATPAAFLSSIVPSLVHRKSEDKMGTTARLLRNLSLTYGMTLFAGQYYQAQIENTSITFSDMLDSTLGIGVSIGADIVRRMVTPRKTVTVDKLV